MLGICTIEMVGFMAIAAIGLVLTLSFSLAI